LYLRHAIGGSEPKLVHLEHQFLTLSNRHGIRIAE
jgi:hypothetical protein